MTNLCECGCDRRVAVRRGTPNRFVHGHNGRDRRPLAERLAALYAKDLSGCWLWQNEPGSHGYGELRVDGELFLAHRLSYVAAYGAIPDDTLVLHKCDVRLCGNPEHLFLGTHQDNSSDMTVKRRSLVGEKQPNAKLTDRRVLEIRAAKGQVEPAACGVTARTVRKIVQGTRWKHLPIGAKAARVALERR